MGLSFLSLLYLQVSYIEEMMKTRKEQFDSAVRNSLSQVSKDVEYAETQRWLVEDITEAEVMEIYLWEHGIEKERILKETASTTTRENLRFSKALFTPEIVKVGIVTNNFHLHRSCALANRLGYPHVYPISAGCKGSLFLNYMMREVPAMWKFWLDKEKDSDII